MARSKLPARNPVPPRVFVAIIDGRVVATFMAVQRSQALELRRERCMDDLMGLQDDVGRPIWDGVAKLTVRNAGPHEVSAHMAALDAAKKKGNWQSDELFVSFPSKGNA